MAKKRSVSLGSDADDEEMGNSEDEVMSDEESEEENDKDTLQNAPTDGEFPFLDTFYGLASASPAERAQSAHAMLQHCLLGPSSNSKDAAYAFRRLLNGLCSGRAAARQGYASAFSSFLKIAYATGALKEIQAEMMKDEAEEKSLLTFVCNQLRKATDASQVHSGKFGKAKGSEERDYKFGRLFGILSVVRSGIMLPTADSDLSEVKETTAGLVDDLIELYHYKNWMREPTAHGIITLMNSFYNSGHSDYTKVVLDDLVKQSIVPNLFAGKGLDSFTAEQVAVAVNIQSHLDLHESELPFPLNEAVISSQTIPILVGALGATSSVVHPRMHVVWDVLWVFLTEEAEENERIRTLQQACPFSDESAIGMVEALMKSLVTEFLLAIGSEGHGSNPTHERRALALSFLKTACGGQFTSSTIGPFAILVDNDLLENVILTTNVVQRLLVDIICAGGSAKQSAHMLKPLALHALEAIVESETIDGMSDSVLDRRLLLVKSFLKCEPRFDGRTKTTTISKLLLLDDSNDFSYSQWLVRMWTMYFEFLEDQILRTVVADEGDVDMEADENSSEPSSYKTLGYIDLLFGAAKRILRLQASGDDVEEFEKFRRSIIRRILGFFMASAFFDCSTLSESKKPKSPKKKSRKQSFDNAGMHPVVAAGLRVKERAVTQSGDPSKCPYAVRVILSSRFFSLLADSESMAVSLKSEAISVDHRQGKDVRVFETLSDLIRGWALLEECGAQRLASSEEVDSIDSERKVDVSSACRTVKQMQEKANGLLQTSVGSDDADLIASTRCAIGGAILASTLCLNFLRCGPSEGFVDEVDDEDSEDGNDEIVETISDLRDIQISLIQASPEDDEEEKSPLFGLAELCIHVLSSPFGTGSQSRGASPKLLRDAVKFAWSGGLSAFATRGAKAVLDEDVLGILLGAIGASAIERFEDDGEESESDSDNYGSDSDDGGDNKGVFSQAGKALGLNEDISEVDMKEKEEEGESIDEEEDVELDPAQLESLLLEDSDAIFDEDDDDDKGFVLEHHAGADAALAQLIKLKQDARKAGRQALERLEISRRLRCVLLLETLLSNSGRQWSNLLHRNVFMKMVLPLLQVRRDLEKALEKSSANQLGKKSVASDSEKRALLERLTSLLKNKLCKIRWSKEPQPPSDDAVDLVRQLMYQARKSSSKENSSCCSAALLAMLKNMADIGGMISASSVYGEALAEWSTKRTTKLQTSLFDDFVQQHQRYV